MALAFPPLPKWTRRTPLRRYFLFPLGRSMNDSDKTLISLKALSAGSGGSILKLHEDVQTCGYKDVQVMFEILRSELEVSSHGGPKQRKQPAWTPPSAWPSSRSPSMIAAAH